MTKATELKTETDFIKAHAEAFNLITSLPDGNAKNQHISHVKAFEAERNLRRLFLHRLNELPNLAQREKAVVVRMIEQSTDRQNDYLDLMRGLTSINQSITMARVVQFFRAFGCAVWLRVAKLRS